MVTINIFKMLYNNVKGNFESNKIKMLLKLFFTIAIVGVVTAVITVGLISFRTNGFSININVLACMMLIVMFIMIMSGVNNICKRMYWAKDNMLLLSLPCDASEIFWAKVLILFVEELKSGLMFTLPMLISFGIMMPSVGTLYYCFIPFSVVIISVLALMIAGLVSIPFAKFCEFANKHKKFKTTFYSCLSVAALSLYLVGISLISDKINFAGQNYQISVSINNFVRFVSLNTVVFLFISKCITFAYGFWGFFGLILIVMVISALTLFAIKSKFYNLITGTEGGGSAKKDKQFDFIYKKQKHLPSLMKRELLDIVRSPGLLSKFFVFTVALPLIVVVYDKLLTALVVNSVGNALISASHILILTMFAMLSNVNTATSISREGGCAYFAKIAPIKFTDYILSKVLTSFIFTVFAILLASALSGYITGLGFVVNFLSAGIAIIISFTHMLITLAMELKKPMLVWVDESEIEQKSGNAKKSLAFALVFSLALFAIMFAFARSNNVAAVWICLFTVVCCLCAGTTLYFCLNARKNFERIGE